MTAYIGCDPATDRGAGAVVGLDDDLSPCWVLDWRRNTFHFRDGEQHTSGKGRPFALSALEGALDLGCPAAVESVTYRKGARRGVLNLALAAGWWSGVLLAERATYAEWTRAVLLERPGTTVKAHEAACRRAAGVSPMGLVRVPVRWPLTWPEWAPTHPHALDAAGLALYAAGWRASVDAPGAAE